MNYFYWRPEGLTSQAATAPETLRAEAEAVAVEWLGASESYSTESVQREPGKQMHVSSRLARPSHEERVC